jgi:hypothetical protein
VIPDEMHHENGIAERKKDDSKKMNGFEKIFSFLVQGVKTIDDGGDGSKTGLFMRLRQY